MPSLVYGPMMIWKHTQGKASGSMYADTIKMIHISQQSTKDGLNKELEGN